MWKLGVNDTLRRVPQICGKTRNAMPSPRWIGEDRRPASCRKAYDGKPYRIKGVSFQATALPTLLRELLIYFKAVLLVVICMKGNALSVRRYWRKGISFLKKMSLFEVF